MPRNTELSKDWVFSLLMFQLELHQEEWIEKTPFYLFLKKIAISFQNNKTNFSFKELHDLFLEEIIITKTNFANYLNKMISFGIIRKEKRDNYVVEPYILIIIKNVEEQINRFQLYNLLYDAELSSVPEEFLLKFNTCHFNVIYRKSFVFSMVEDFLQDVRKSLVVSIQDIIYYSHPFEEFFKKKSMDKNVTIIVIIYSKNDFKLLRFFGPEPADIMLKKEKLLVTLNFSRKKLNYNMFLADKKRLLISFPYKKEPLNLPNYFLKTMEKGVVKLFLDDFYSFLKKMNYESYL